MFVEYTGLWAAGGSWLFNIAYSYWIYEDSQRYKKKAWHWLFLLQLGNPVGMFWNNFYQYEVLPSRGIFQYLVPLFKYDVTQFANPLFVMDLQFLWAIVTSIISGTMTYVVIYWLYKDCKRNNIRATPWLFATQFIGAAPWPISYFVPLGGYTGQVFIMVGYILHKNGYI